MKNPNRRYYKVLLAFLLLCGLVSLSWLGAGPGFGLVQAKITQGHVALNKFHPGIKAAMAVQDRHTPRLMALPQVVGTATGVTDAAEPAVLVFVRRAVAPSAIPPTLEGVPVVVEVTGEFVSMAPPTGKGKGNSIDPAGRFDRPVPIGVSTGNVGECSAGTIGARVKSGGNVYALSNNHVYALENEAGIGSAVLQPGRYDTNCATDPADVIGTLSDFEAMVFSTEANNMIDAAIVLSSDANLGNATPINGYGVPRTTTVEAVLGAAVQKYGHTTGLTKGTITGINAIILVGYSSGTARFVNQIVVSGSKPLLKAGDSGSLLVTDPGRSPVGLLFAGSSSGKAGIANPIGLVLSRFNVTIDGE